MVTDPGPTNRPAPTPPPAHPRGARKFLLNLGIVSFSVLFVSSNAAFLFFRLKQPDWPPEGMPSMPLGIWLSTVIIIGCSMLLQLGLHSIRQGRPATLKTCLGLTLVLALVFLINQGVSWLPLIQANISDGPNIYTFTFWMLVSLHGLHLLGGMVPLGYATHASANNFYSSKSYEGIELLVRYWHFLAIVWLVLFATLLATA